MHHLIAMGMPSNKKSQNYRVLKLIIGQINTLNQSVAIFYPATSANLMDFLSMDFYVTFETNETLF
jgi:hypothetical protein